MSKPAKGHHLGVDIYRSNLTRSEPPTKFLDFLAAISPVFGMQIADDSLVSRDDERWGDARSVGSKLKWGLSRMLLRRLKSVGSKLKWRLSLKNTLKKTTFCNTLPMILIGHGNHRMA
jgi:hypothetical protein